MATEIETKTADFENGSKAEKPVDSGEMLDTDADAPSKKKKKRKAAADALPELEVDLSLPEPPSKRARRALKKGKPLPTKPKSDDEDDDADDDDGTKKDKKDKDGKPAKEPRSQFGIWIGNLPFTVMRTQLFRWFVDSSGGAITEDDITRVNLPLAKKDKRGGPPARSWPGKPAEAETSSDAAAAPGSTTSQNKGFAYVDFSTYAAQIAAIALSESELEGRRVLIKDSKSFDGRPAPTAAAAAAAAAAGDAGAVSSEGAAAVAAAAAPPGATSTKIFVGNLGFDTTEEDLRRHFAPCGPVAWAKVATFPDNTEKCRGYGWVQFGGSSGAGVAGAGGADSDDDEDEDKVRPAASNAKQSPATAAAIAGEAAAAAVRGFVRIEETIDTEEDFAAEAAAIGEGDEEKGSDADDDDGDDDDDEKTAVATKRAPPRTRTRKWWVNKLKGRPLKVQFAEDDRVRYKKRFGKDRPQDRVQRTDRPATTQNREPRRQQRDRSGGEGAAQGKEYNYQDLSIARRTGAITESLGKKTLLE